MKSTAAVVAMAAIPVAAAQTSLWVDPETHLVWSAADNGSAISGRQADRYCRESRVGGYRDWALPTIDQLQTLFGGPENEGGRHVRGPVRLTGWEWSSTAGQNPGEQWSLDFGDGGRASVATGDSGQNRALCVRARATGSQQPQGKNK